MADDLKRTEQLQQKPPSTSPIKSVNDSLKDENKPIDIYEKTTVPAPIKKPTALQPLAPQKSVAAPYPIPPTPSRTKPIIPPQPIASEPTIQSQSKSVYPSQSIPAKTATPSFSMPQKPIAKPNILTQPEEKKIIVAKTPPINIPKPEAPKQKIIPNIPDDILTKPGATRPNRKKILIAAITAIIIITSVGGYYYWPTTPNIIENGEPTNIPQRKLIKLIDNNNIYYVTEIGTKRLIPNETILNSYPLNQLEAIITVSQEEFDHYPENIFIKLPDDPKIYKLENGRKRWLKNEDASKNPDFDWDKVAPVNQTEFDFYPEGAPIE